MKSVSELIPVLQIAIGPMILISGIGLLLLTMTNRLGRTIDRARLLDAKLTSGEESSRALIQQQLRILWKRARLVRAAIAWASMSALAAALLIIVLFFTALWVIETAWVIGALFVVCMFCLIVSLVVFIYDVNQALAALKLELNIDGK